MLVSDSDSTAPNKGATKDNDSRNDTDSSGLPNMWVLDKGASSNLL